MMTGDGLLELRRRTATKLVYGRSVWILTMMQSCASAAKLRAAGPFSPSASVPRQQPVPATSDRRPAVPVVDASSERRAGKEMILQRFVREPLIYSPFLSIL